MVCRFNERRARNVWKVSTVVDLIFFFPRKKKGKKTQHVLPTIAGTKHVLGCHHHHIRARKKGMTFYAPKIQKSTSGI
jgi:hypothetical protein